MPLPKLSLILGGAASGKSGFAERLLANSPNRIYLATARVWDDEMQDKVTRHIDQRGLDWHTIEEPLEITKLLRDRSKGETLLLDCATMWLTNLMMENRDIPSATGELLEALKECAATVVIVSNELGLSVVPESAMARAFRNSQGQLNQALAVQSDLVVFIAAGLPMVLKGQLP